MDPTTLLALPEATKREWVHARLEVVALEAAHRLATAPDAQERRRLTRTMRTAQRAADRLVAHREAP